MVGRLVGDTGDLMSPVILTQPIPESEVGSLAAEVAELIAPTTPYFLLNPWLGPDFASHGLAFLGHPPLMVRSPAPAGVRVVEVRDALELARAAEVVITGYRPQGSAPGSVLQPGLLDGTTRVWLGYADGEPVSVAAARRTNGWAMSPWSAGPRGCGFRKACRLASTGRTGA